MYSDSRAQALSALSQFLVAKQSIGDTLLRVSEITTDALPAAEMAGIAVLGDDGKPTTGVFTDDEAPEVDSAQYESGRGPCLDAWRTGQIVRIDDMAGAGDQYPEFSTMAKEHGIESTLSLPLVAGGDGIGALNLYARKVGGFTSHDEGLGMELAAAAAIVLANASSYWGATTLNDQLQEAMKSRAVIEQAKGMLMAQRPDITADAAFDMLRRASQRENMKLRDIARRIVDRERSSERP